MNRLLPLVACLALGLLVCVLLCGVAQAGESRPLPGNVGGALVPEELKAPAEEAEGVVEGEEGKAGEGQEDKGLADKAQEKLSEFSVHVDKAFSVVAEHKIMGLLAVFVLTLAGSLLLIFGWRLLNALFVPFSALMGIALGGLLGFQLAVSLSLMGGTGTALVAGLVGAVAGALLFAGAAVRAQPVAWMLIVISPFLVVSTFLFPLGNTGRFAALGAVVLGMVLGFASMMKRQPLVIFSTALLGAICLVFCFGVIVHLTQVSALVAALSFAYKYPFALLGAIGLMTLLGADLQAVLTPSEAFPGDSVGGMAGPS